MSIQKRHREASEIEYMLVKLTEKLTAISVLVFFLGLATMFYFHIDVGSEREFAKFLHNFGYTGYKFDPVAGSIFYVIGAIFLAICARVLNKAIDFITGKATWKSEM